MAAVCPGAGTGPRPGNAPAAACGPPAPSVAGSAHRPDIRPDNRPDTSAVAGPVTGPDVALPASSVDGLAAEAPLYHDVADDPADGTAHWLITADGLRLRIAHWPGAPDAAPAGTVLLFPGRTEYVEKYGPLARALRAEGLGTLSIDWRGQGLSDRILDDPLGGHVVAFTDYQRDVAAMVAHAAARDLPRPWHLLAHSMGGAIGLRALLNGLPVASATFSAPMWGIALKGSLRPLAWSVAWAAGHAGLDHHYAPGTSGAVYLSTTPFAANLLTTDRVVYDWMLRQTEVHPDLALGGPSLRWLGEALREARALARRPSPEVPTLVLLGHDEAVVDPAAVHARMGRWPGGTLHLLPGARHEVLMEAPLIRNAALRLTLDHIRRHRRPKSDAGTPGAPGARYDGPTKAPR